MTAGRTIAPQYAAGATVTGVLAMAELRSGDVVANRFRIERLLGMGGMGVVYQARDLELDVDVALKLLRPELASRPDAFERFRQELLLARQVSSPHVVRIHDLVRHGEVWLISMDFVPGQSLEKLLDTRGRLPPDDAIRIVRQLALGLSAAHQRGVIHRDLKPANVLIGEDGEARITDFGVARSAGSTGITVSGVIIGTPEYLSPEQARADPVDARSDLYALGLIFYEMLTGTLPFRGGTPAEMLAQRIVRDPPPPDTVTADLPDFAVRLCSRLLELRPARRFQSADEVVRAIDAKRVPRGPVRRSSLAAVLTVVAVLAIAGGFVAWRQRTGTTTTEQTTVRTADLAMLPFVVTGGTEPDTDLAAGIRQLFATSLAGAQAIDSEDARQVDRALRELRYDADAARRQRARVLETLGARRLLEGDLSRDSAGLYTVSLHLRDSRSAEPLWSSTTRAVQAFSLASALKDLQRDVSRRLGLAHAPTTAWPDTDGIRLIGHLYNQHDTAPKDVAALTQTAQKAASPALWWSIEESLDHADRSVEAASLARAAKDALASHDDYDSKRARAYALILLGENDAAVKSLKALISEAPNDHAVRLLLARGEGDLGDFDAAAKTLLAIVAEDPRNVDAWFALGKYSILSGDSKRAVDDYLTRAQVLANRLDDRRMQANVVHALGLGYQNLGQLGYAASQFEQAIRLRKALGDDRGVAISLRNLSTVYAVQGDFKSAQDALNQARSLLEPLGDSAAMADLTNDEGVLKEERGDYRGALASYRNALTLYQSLGNARQIGNSLLNVGFAYYQVGEFDNAQVYWNQAASTYGKINDFVGIVRAKQSLGLAETARGDFAAAREALEGSLRQAEELQMAEERSISLANLADLDRLEGRNAAALDFAKRALDQFKQREDTRGIVEMTLLRAATLRNTGDWDAAAAALSELSPESVENSEQKALLYWGLGEIALGRGDAANALAEADQAVGTAENAHSYGSELSARLLRARALHAQGKNAESVAELAKARDGLARYASVPLRLQLAETALRVTGSAAASDYRSARSELARLPSYARAFEIHALAARTLDEPGAAESARDAYAGLAKDTPPAQREALAKLAASYGIEVAAAHE